MININVIENRQNVYYPFTNVGVLTLADEHNLRGGVKIRL